MSVSLCPLTPASALFISNPELSDAGVGPKELGDLLCGLDWNAIRNEDQSKGASVRELYYTPQGPRIGKLSGWRESESLGERPFFRTGSLEKLICSEWVSEVRKFGILGAIQP